MSLQAELQALFDRYAAAYRAADTEACAAVFAEDAVLISPFGPTAVGRAAIAKTHGDWVNEDAEGKEVAITACGGGGDFAWCLAAYREGDHAGDGTSLNVLERQSDGHWLIRVCSLNATFAENTPG
ncbi:YybH family protein [Tropicimonas marinistellae]|uniref:YybH family protein n=1 Tax=Tropicimonas marinistellae TaxID=1739787 RepID=UPI000832F778|nr:SgcJ/EcaC family oxidoreductase [Tropicimonas marinistellae]